MPLAAGTRLGNYEIVGPLGAGGMGEVYRAKDTKLDREVAIKVLPAAFAQHPDRLARFEREAKVLASLNHPNIASIYAVEESSEGKALVMELVQGQTLKGPVPVDTALKYAAQIADALAAAHERGITHRDLKPANIMLTPEGTIKVLDFGLAAVTQPSQGEGEADNNIATLTMSPTTAGMIMGTAAYMSPEQARGQTVDRRADIWALGVVLWELLTGKQLFCGDTVSDILASVLKEEPNLERVPAKVRPLLKRCLEREPKKRLQAIGDWELLLVEDAPPASAPAVPASRHRSWLPWCIAAFLLLALMPANIIHFRETPPPEQTLRYTVAAPENSTVHSLAISPDGRTLVIAAVVNGKRQLWLRAMDALQAQPMAFTEDATYPFWSPDSRYIGFFAQSKLKKVAASGGPAQSLCDVPLGRGGSWNREDVIVFSPGNGGISIQRVAAAGGVPVDVTKTKGALKHPVFLPDGRHFLYISANGPAEQTGIYVGSLDGKENRRVLPDVSSVVFAPPVQGGRVGHVLFVREGTLMAALFDAGSAQVSGDVFPVAEGVTLTTDLNYVRDTVSENGMLLYQTGGDSGGTNQFGWYDRSGKSLGPVGAPGPVWDPAISPDEKSVVFDRASRAVSDLWVRDLSRGTETRFTSNASSNLSPVWSPKGDRIVFASNRKGGVFNLYQKAASGSGQDELLLPNSLIDAAHQWSRDGRFIVYVEIDPKTKSDLWVLPTEGAAAERKPIPFLRTEFNELFDQLSPDNHWMAFTSDRSGRREVYVRPFPPGEGEWTISIAGGEQPRWRGDGKELFFEAADGKMMAVPVKAAAGPKPSFEAGTPVALFDAHMVHRPAGGLIEYDVTADGKRFLINTAGGSGAASPPLTVVTNWNAGLKK
jgi:serine/threonine protein kinase/Tol biopolymer transport system component